MYSHRPRTSCSASVRPPSTYHTPSARGSPHRRAPSMAPCTSVGNSSECCPAHQPAARRSAMTSMQQSNRQRRSQRGSGWSTSPSSFKGLEAGNCHAGVWRVRGVRWGFCGCVWCLQSKVRACEACDHRYLDPVATAPHSPSGPLGGAVVQGVGLRLLIARVAGSGPTACAPQAQEAPRGALVLTKGLGQPLGVDASMAI